ncbi:MAG: hypothetical protein QXQ20_08475 [Candidatus Nezhaarchaeales archaeon]
MSKLIMTPHDLRQELRGLGCDVHVKVAQVIDEIEESTLTYQLKSIRLIGDCYLYSLTTQIRSLDMSSALFL